MVKSKLKTIITQIGCSTKNDQFGIRTHTEQHLLQRNSPRIVIKTWRLHGISFWSRLTRIHAQKTAQNQVYCLKSIIGWRVGLLP